MIKIFNRLRIDRNFLKLAKNIYQKEKNDPKPTSYLMAED